MIRTTCLILISALLFSCSPENTSTQSGENPSQLFTKLSHNKTGIDFKNELREDVNSNYNILSFDYYFNGAGVAVGDINNDGLSDLFFTANTGPNKLYLNKGNFNFKDITEDAGIGEGNWSTGANIIDINKDGLMDIYVCQAGPDNAIGARNNLLYINKGDNTFEEKAAELGLADPRLSMHAAFFDYDRDGYLDCYVMNESIYARVNIDKILQEIKDENKLKASSGTLYKNVKGKFVDVSKQAGILKYGYGLGLAIADFNNDFWPDIYVANDYSAPDMMWINQKNGTFKDEIKNRTDHTSWFSMGIDVADINNDGMQDIGVVDMATQDHFLGKTLMAPMDQAFFNMTINELNYQRQHMFNALQLNMGNGRYSNIASLANIQSTEWSWASLFADFDNDGDKDYFVSNGYKRCHRDNDFQAKLSAAMKRYNGKIPSAERQGLYDQIPSYKTKNILFENNGFAEFNDKAAEWGVDDLSFSNGAAYADLDNDGDLDLVVNNIDDYAFVYRNNAQKNYLRVELDSERPSLGTKVHIYVDGKQQLQVYNPVRGYMSKMEDQLHFGLNDQTNVDSLLVIWPDQKTQLINNVKANQLISLSHKDANRNNSKQNKKAKVIFAKAKNIDFKHQENQFNDFAKEVLLPYKQSSLGPFISKGDVDNNGLDDFYVGGAKGQSGALFLQMAEGNWKKSSTAVFSKDKAHEDMKALFFDGDKDGDLDLYVVSGGSEFQLNDRLLQDRYYSNDGKGNFKKVKSALPDMTFPGMKASASDFDGDGDLDIFVSGRIIPQKYPYHSNSVLLENEGGKFKDISKNQDDELINAGIINDAVWTDIDGDKDLDLIMAGEWTKLKVFENDDGNLVPKEATEGITGWWYSLKAIDIDNDGDQDIVAGNLGLNSKFSASSKKPFKVYADDFDNNGSCDIVLAKDYKGKTVPVRGRQCSSEQMPFITEKFETYTEFANATVTDILGESKLSEALTLTTTSFSSAVFLNDGNGNFEMKELPKNAQMFPIWGIETADLNKDELPDLILTGNIYDMEVETPRLDAGKGLVLLNEDNGNFKAISADESGIYMQGDLRNVQLLRSNQNKKILLTSRNNDTILSYTLND